jgi:L-ascorbate metabolism protein UlaG (beta-lactamase superfamily)
MTRLPAVIGLCRKALELTLIAIAALAAATASCQAGAKPDCVDGRCGCDETVARASADPQAHPLVITFFGVSTLLFDDGRDRILTDGYFTRPGLIETAFTRLSSDSGAIADGLRPGSPDLRAVLVAHAHHDHALDVAAIARQERSAVVIGTPSVVKLAGAQGVEADRLCSAVDGETLRYGDFQVQPLYAPHGPPLPVIGSIIDQDLADPPRGPAHFTAFRDDRNLSFLIQHRGEVRILVHPSTGRRDLTDLSPSIVFVGIGRMSALPEGEADLYLAGLIDDGVELVVPIHWDAFTTPPGQPLTYTPWPFDDVRTSMRLLCGFIAGRPRASVLRPDAGSRLIVAADGAWRPEGDWTPMCVN